MIRKFFFYSTAAVITTSAVKLENANNQLLQNPSEAMLDLSPAEAATILA